MTTFLPFFIILFASIVFGTIFEKIHLPWVVALILAGVVIGPFGLKLLELSPTIEFLGQAGLVFVMFLAGLETKLEGIKQLGRETLPLSFINGFVPFLVGLCLGLAFDYSSPISLLIGIIFISSSIAIVIPSLESQNILKTKLGQAIMATSIVQDVASLILLSLFLQTENPLATLPLWLFYPLLLGSLILLKIFLPKIEKLLAGNHKKDRFQTQVRAVFFTLFGTVILFELLGLHSIIGGFFAGFVLADTVSSEELKQKLRAIGYGVFVPTFFVVVGMETDLSIFANATEAIFFTLAIVASSVVSKFTSGFAAAKLLHFNSKQAVLFGVSSIPQLSTTLAATFSAKSLNLIDTRLFAAFIVLSVVTTLIGPTLMNLSIESLLTKKDLHHKK